MGDVNNRTCTVNNFMYKIKVQADQVSNIIVFDTDETMAIRRV